EEKEYLNHSNSLNNLRSLVIHDILTQKKVSHTLLAAERWALILKFSFEQNDFHTSTAISTALNTLDKVIERLNPNAQGLIFYTKKFCNRPRALHNLHSEKADNNEQVIPYLGSLGFLLDAIKNQIGNSKKETLEDKQMEYSAAYKRMQDDLSIGILSFQ